MLNLSSAFKNELNNDNRNYLCYASITLTNGTVLNLENDDIWTDGFVIEDSVSGTGSFDIGSAIINKLTLVLNNIYETYSEYDFTDAVVIPYVGLELPDGTIEKIRRGLFTVDEASYDGSLITLSCLDEMYKLDYAYSESSLTYPATLSEIVQDACYVCGATLLTTTFNNSSYTVQKRPDDESLTFRQVLSWAAQIACSWARFDVYGRLRFDWYDQSVFETHDGLNGGIFDESTPYATGDRAHGGYFKPWTKGDDYSGRTFKELSGYHHVYSMSSMNLCTDDVVITGLKVTESFEETDTEKVQSFLFGSEGYVLSIEGNDLIQQGAAKKVAQAIGSRVVGLRFRPFDISALNDPSIEAGDPVYITDRKNRSYQSFVTSTTFKVGSYQQIQCSAETPSRNSADRFSEATRSIVQARREASRKISDYDKAVQMLTSLITQSFGVFKTEEVLDDGSTIFYLHNKPKLSDSATIWKMTADAFVVSTDGGKTWNAGMDSSGNAVVNVLSAIGINFDWAKGGTLTLGGQNNTNGLLRVLSAAGVEIGKLGYDGIKATRGRIGGWDILDNEISNENGNLKVFLCNGTNGNKDFLVVRVKKSDGSYSYPFFVRADGHVGINLSDQSNSTPPITIMNKDGGYMHVGADGFDVSFGTHFAKLYYNSGGFVRLSLGRDGAEKMRADSDGMLLSKYGIKSSGTPNVHMNSAGVILECSSSSRRYKNSESEDLGEMDPEKLYDLSVKTYKYNDGYLDESDRRSGQTFIGFIAEDVEKVYPWAVDYDEEGRSETWNERVMIPAMLKLIQEQNKRIRKLEEKMGGGS